MHGSENKVKHKIINNASAITLAGMTMSVSAVSMSVCRCRGCWRVTACRYPWNT